jgi:hypothetical protein
MEYTDIIKDPTWAKDIKIGAVNEEALANYLIRTIPGTQIAKLCASYIFKDVNNGAEPIVMTEEVFKRHFRIQGWKEIEGFTGTRETRGRKEQNY